MYNCVDMHITEEGHVFIKLIKKTPENTFGDRIYRFDLNNRRGDALYGSALTYSRQGDMLIGTITLPSRGLRKLAVLSLMTGMIKELKAIYGGVIDGYVCTVYPDARLPHRDCGLSLV